MRNVNESSTVFDARKWCAEALFAGRFRRGGWIERRSRTREGIASVTKKSTEDFRGPIRLVAAFDSGPQERMENRLPRNR